MGEAPHFGDNASEYGSVPYIMGHSAELDESVAWMNSAETFVFINEAHAGERLNTAFISEGNALEFYLLAHKKSYGEPLSDSATVMTPECECPAAMKETLKLLFAKKLTSLGLRLSSASPWPSWPSSP